MARVEIRNVTRRFGTLEAVKDVPIAIEAGKFFTLLGPSGCGKTTIQRMIARFARARPADMDESLFEAARDPGTTPWGIFRRIILLPIMPALVAGFLMAFTFSIDDFVVTFFVAGVGVKPRRCRSAP